MPRLGTGVLAIALVATACTVQPIEDPGIGAGSLTSTVFAADGTVLTQWHAGEDRVLVSYAELPRHLVDAVVAIEDHRFWVHGGVDPRAVVRAAGAFGEAGYEVHTWLAHPMGSARLGYAQGVPKERIHRGRLDGGDAELVDLLERSGALEKREFTG